MSKVAHFWLGVFVIIGFSSFTASVADQTPAAIPIGALQGITKLVSTNNWGGLYYDVVPKLILEENIKSIAEIGVGYGGHADSILNTSVEHYYGIDPYLFNFNPRDQFNTDVGTLSTYSGQENFDFLYQWVKDFRLASFGDRCHLIREKSVKAAQLFQDESLDCIFIDGDQRYLAVMKDLTAWYPKLKNGGIICGDDYWMSQVAGAVDNYFAGMNKKVYFITSKSDYKIWAVRK